jgi:protein-disulfide isomerase/uncharacterized membrane protein
MTDGTPDSIPGPAKTRLAVKPGWTAFVLAALAMTGILVSMYLTHVHLQVNGNAAGDYQSFCNFGESLNCEDVAASAYSQFLGVPVSLWGLFGYFVLLAVVLLGALRPTTPGHLGFAGIILAWGLAGLPVSGALAFISFTKIRALCPFCMVLYVVNISILVPGIMLAREQGGFAAVLRADVRRIRGSLPATAAICLVIAGMTGALTVFYPRFAAAPPSPPAHECHCGCDAGYSTEQGFPALGDPGAPVTVEEFSDYECPYCRIAHKQLRDLVAGKYKGRVSLVHRNYPLDQACNRNITRPFHRNACAAARGAICAERQKRFWDYSELMFQNQNRLGPDDLVSYAGQIGLDVRLFKECMGARQTETQLQRDIRDGAGRGVSGTPSFVINGVFYLGPPAEGFEKTMDEALSRCMNKPANGKAAQ